jgi:biofilm protein TabA
MIITNLKNLDTYYGLIPQLKIVRKFIQDHPEGISKGRHNLDGGCYINVNEGKTISTSEALFEAHKTYLDVHYLFSGHEEVEYNDIANLPVEKEYNPEMEAAFYKGEGILIEIDPGMLYIVFPEDAHKPCVHENDSQGLEFKKYIFKIPYKRAEQ